MSEADDSGLSPRDDALEWELHAALSALDRVPILEQPWLRGVDEHYWVRLEGNRAGYLQLARILVRAASDRVTNAEYVATDGPNKDLCSLFVSSSHLGLQLRPRIEAPPPRGPVGTRRFREQLRHAAALWGCGLAAFLAATILLLVLGGMLTWLRDR